VGKSGLYSDKTNVKFDDFQASLGFARDPKGFRLSGTASASITGGHLQVDSGAWGGVAVVDGFTGTTYTVQVVVDPSDVGEQNEIWIHYQDANNAYRVTVYSQNEIHLDRVKNGQWANLYMYAVGGASNQTVTVTYLFTGGAYKIRVYVDFVQKFEVTESQIPSGQVALGSAPFSGPAKFDNLKVGYDNNADGDLNDAGDDVLISETFGSTSKTSRKSYGSST